MVVGASMPSEHGQEEVWSLGARTWHLRPLEAWLRHVWAPRARWRNVHTPPGHGQAHMSPLTWLRGAIFAIDMERGLHLLIRPLTVSNAPKLHASWSHLLCRYTTASLVEKEKKKFSQVVVFTLANGTATLVVQRWPGGLWGDGNTPSRLRNHSHPTLDPDMSTAVSGVSAGHR